MATVKDAYRSLRSTNMFSRILTTLKLSFDQDFMQSTLVYLRYSSTPNISREYTMRITLIYERIRLLVEQQYGPLHSRYAWASHILSAV